MKKTKALPLILSGVAVILVAVIVLLIVIIKPGSGAGEVSNSIIQNINILHRARNIEYSTISL